MIEEQQKGSGVEGEGEGRETLVTRLEKRRGEGKGVGGGFKACWCASDLPPGKWGNKGIQTTSSLGKRHNQIWIEEL